MKSKTLCTEMNSNAAEQICSWIYEPPYDVYNYMPYDEAIKSGAAITKPENAERYICFWENDILAAYVSIISEKEKVFIGIGLAPRLCGQGFGKCYLEQAVAEAQKRFPESEMWVQVRSWNERAIQCYRKCGFVEKYSEIVKDRSENETEFVFMKFELLTLEAVCNENLSYYKEYEKAFENDLKQYQSRIYPDKNLSFLRWYHIKINNKYSGAVWLEKKAEENFAVLGIFIADISLRGKGIGEAAIRQIIEKDLCNIGSNKVILRVRKTNKRAVACYKKVGFKEIQRYLKGEIEIIEMEFIC